MSKQEKIDQLAGQIIADPLCADLAQQATQLVVGSGNLDADIVFIGEAPGKKEDEQGIPFIGASGRFLDEMLTAANMNRQDVYITNIVKYRPPNNRDPSKAEKAAFLPYLIQQLEIILPKVIITLGRHSMEYFLPDEKIGDVHGQPRQVILSETEVILIPLFHPAAALYNGSLRQTLISDFLMVPELISRAA